MGAFYDHHLCSGTVPRNAEKDLLTTLSSCCNSMRAGMQQREKGEREESRKNRRREIESGISRSWSQTPRAQDWVASPKKNPLMIQT